MVDQATAQIDAINKRIAQMRAPIDRMQKSVQRFVDVSGLRKVAQGFDWIGRAASSVFRTLSNIVPVMGAITGAASIAGMVRLVNSYADWSHQLVQNADDIGMTTQQLEQFQNATRVAGGDAGDMTESLKSLHTTVADFAIGRGNFIEVGQMANYLGVHLRDANGQIRTAADLMPELIEKIAALPDPAQRAREATTLLGAAGGRLVETFRQSHTGFGQAFEDARRYAALTDQEKDSMQSFTEAQGRAGAAFGSLGEHISAVIARDFGPLLNRLSEFVEKHTPDIVAAVDRISQRFIDWLQGVDWSGVQAGIDKLLDRLKWVTQNLDTIKDVAEAVAVAFAVKWGVGIVANIAAVTTALGPLNAALLPIIAGLGVLTAYERNKAGQQEIEDKAKGMGFQQQSGGLFGMPTFRNPTTGETLTYDQMLERQGRPHGGGGWLERGLGALWDRAVKGPEAIQRQAAPGGYLPGGVTPANLSLPQDTVQRGGAITARLASDLQLTGPQAAGITGNLQAESGLQAVQERNPIGGGRGGIGWAQWTGPRRDEFEAYAKANNLDPKSDAANYGFLVHELQGASNARLLEQLRSLKGPDTARQAAALVERLYERPAVSNAGVRGQYADRFAGTLPVPPVPPAPPVAAAPPVAVAPPVTVPPPTPPNGAVDVSITHKNAPPNSSVTATGTGSVNVSPVRVEHQDMASI